MSIIISEIRIKNFRSLRDINVKLSPNITLLVGMNNAGKTTFLRALNIALNTDRHLISKDDLFINKDGDELPEDKRFIAIDVKIIPTNGSNIFTEKWAYNFKDGSISTDANGNEFFAYRTKIDFAENKYFSQIFRYKIMNWESGDADETDGGILNVDISNMPFYFIDAQRDLNEEISKRTSDFGTLVSKVKYDKAIKEELETQLKNLNDKAVEDSAVLKKLRTNLEKLNRTVQNNGKGVEITPFPKKVRDLSKGMKVHFQDGESDSFSLEYHGMGTRSWASLLTFKAKIEQYVDEHNDENEPFHPSLGLEEPEAHLHPNAQRQVYGQLKEIQGQKIISTHSPYIVQQADLSEIRHFSKKADETFVSTIDIENLNTDELRKINREALPSGDLLFSKAIVLFEGETESQSFPIFAFKYWEVKSYEIGVSFIKVNGNNYKPYLALAKACNIPWFIFSDYDNGNIKKGVDNALEYVGYNKNNNYSNVVKLEKSIEKYLIEEGYQNELKKGINNWFLTTITEETDERQVTAGQDKINAYNDTDLLKDISSDNGKVRYPSYWAKIISDREDDKNIPSKIKDIFDEIEYILNAKEETRNANT